MIRTPIVVPTNEHGEGFAQTSIPWAKFVSVTHNGADPRHDGAYWPGETHASQRDGGNVLVSVTGCRPSTPEIVFVTSTE